LSKDLSKKRFSRKCSKIISRNNISKFVLRDLKKLKRNGGDFDALFVGSGGSLERLIGLDTQNVNH
tara:strand:+ start:315 stop:512 length:198 start_codon:yes stop_codon:yes gene_type:complete